MHNVFSREYMYHHALRRLLRGLILLIVFSLVYIGWGDRRDATGAASQVVGSGSLGFIAKWVSPVFTYTLTNSGNVAIAQGSFGSVNVTVTHTGGTPEVVNFAASKVTGLPAGVTPSFNVAGCTPPPNGTCSTTLTLAVSSATALGSYPILVQDNGPLGHTTSFNLVVIAASGAFTFHVSHDQNINVTQGESGINTITVTTLGGTSQSVSLLASPPITGVTYAFAPSACDPGGSSCSSTLTVTTTGGTPKGIYTITVTGTAGAATDQDTFTLSVSTSISIPTFKEIAPQ